MLICSPVHSVVHLQMKERELTSFHERIAQLQSNLAQMKQSVEEMESRKANQHSRPSQTDAPLPPTKRAVAEDPLLSSFSFSTSLLGVSGVGVDRTRLSLLERDRVSAAALAATGPHSPSGGHSAVLEFEHEKQIALNELDSRWRREVQHVQAESQRVLERLTARLEEERRNVERLQASLKDTTSKLEQVCILRDDIFSTMIYFCTVF